MSKQKKNKYSSVTFIGIKRMMMAVIIFMAFMIMPTITNAAPQCSGNLVPTLQMNDPACYVRSTTKTNSSTWVDTSYYVTKSCGPVYIKPADYGSYYCYQCCYSTGGCDALYCGGPWHGYWCDNGHGGVPGYSSETWKVDRGYWKTITHVHNSYKCYYTKVVEWSICDPVTGTQTGTKLTRHSKNGTDCNNLNDATTIPCIPDTQKCNGTCKANSECTGLEQCISGKCRNPDCPSETDCKCPPPTQIKCNGTCTTTAQCDGTNECISGKCRNAECSSEPDCKCPSTSDCPTGSEYGNGYIFDYVDTKWSDWGNRTFCMEGDVVNPANPTFPPPGGASEIWGCGSSAKECQAYRWPKDVKCPFLHNPSSYDYDVTRGDKIIDFYKPVIPKERAGLISSGSAKRAQFAQEFNLPAGEYEVYLSAYDSYNTRVKATQDHEEFYITLENSTGDKLAETSSTKDLKDKVKTAWWNGPNGYTSGVNGGVSDSNLEVSNGVTTVVARHTVYPAEGSNSLVPVCAWFKRVDGNGGGGSPLPSTVNCGGTCTNDVDCKGANTCIGGSCKNSDCSGETSCKCSCNQSCADNGICKDIHTCEGDKCINSACPNENDCECSGVEGSVKAPEDCGDNCEEGKIIEARP